ncbi:DNA repair protein RecO [Simiduia agarivorans]|uniref:DNA repair protein RecO n=1 Tax=Simiduia agarivorans (strain DSM 21679 / JCM 13881 / BCRC 17597 / SA1) TaxID=1117647 RepID=K4KFM1_SIMAS|nr:DNA repair protein RecO [Simiduia agarivorans]AFU97874.1 DNA repair protein RecO [Simiduia agarivorans SA1 = DSM 21679]
MIVLDGEPAFVLHSRHYGETSLIVDLFTRSHGRLAAYARGARKRSKKSASNPLAPFIPLIVSTQGRGALKSLTMIDAVATPFKLSGRCLYCGLYLNELLMRVLPEQESQETIFQSYMQLIGRLANIDDRELPAHELYLRRFEWQLIQAAGVSFSLEQEADTQRPLVPGQRYAYRHGLGLVAAEIDAENAVGGDAILNFLSAPELTEAARTDLKRFMRQVLAPLLGRKPLASRALFSQ